MKTLFETTGKAVELIAFSLVPVWIIIVIINSIFN